MSSPATVSLARHPQSRCDAVRGITACVRRLAQDVLAVRYVLDADLDRLIIPPLAAPNRADRLWQHTCFELFVRPDAAGGYYELNFAPSGAWALYAFTAYRAAASSAAVADPPEVTVSRAPNRLSVEAVVRLGALVPTGADSGRSIGLSAVIEDSAGGLSYWALAHPPGPPDFHHADAFAFPLPHL